MLGVQEVLTGVGSTGNLFAAVFNTHSVQTQGWRGGVGVIIIPTIPLRCNLPVS